MDKGISADNDLMARVFNGLPFPAMLVDDDVRILLSNEASKALMPPDTDPSMKMGGEAFQCVNAPEKGCGKGDFCNDCVIRNSVNAAFKEDKTVLFRRTHLKLFRDGKTVQANLLVTATPVKRGQDKLIILIIEDVNELIHLSRLLPICANCKKIRDNKGSWENIEKYMEQRIDVDFSHGLCPDCMKKLYGDQIGIR